MIFFFEKVFFFKNNEFRMSKNIKLYFIFFFRLWEALYRVCWEVLYPLMLLKRYRVC
jgi:multisubunit Na+/H+ antiporter MnhE subunit